MRADMAKVLVERPRLRRPPRGKGSPYPRAEMGRRFARPLEDAPRHQSMAAFHRRKLLNENLAPLRRFLEAQVGRPWRCVYGEIAQHIRPTSAVQAHIKQHVDDFVVTTAHYVDGVLHGVVYGRPQPLNRRFWRERLYVCPRTGILRRVPALPEPRPRFGRRIALGTRHELREVDGVWRHVTLARRPTRWPCARRGCGSRRTSMPSTTAPGAAADRTPDGLPRSPRNRVWLLAVSVADLAADPPDRRALHARRAQREMAAALDGRGDGHPLHVRRGFLEVALALLPTIGVAVLVVGLVGLAALGEEGLVLEVSTVDGVPAPRCQQRHADRPPHRPPRWHHVRAPSWMDRPRFIGS